MRPYQENPALWTGNFVAFLQYVGHSWNNICQLIRDRFPAMRSFFSIYVSERRLADVGAVLAIIAEIFLNYGQYCGALTADERDDLLQEFTTISALRCWTPKSSLVRLVSLSFAARL